MAEPLDTELCKAQSLQGPSTLWEEHDEVGYIIAKRQFSEDRALPMGTFEEAETLAGNS